MNPTTVKQLANRVARAITQRGQLAELARLAKLDRVAVQKIADGRTLNPGILTVGRLTRALDKLTQTSAPVPPSRALRRSTKKAGHSSPAPVEHITGAADTPTPPAAPATSTPGAH